MKLNSYKIIVTSGPTREFIDPIRFISNPSTGKMGFYIAKAALHLGFSVSYICGTVEKEFSYIEGVSNIQVTSTLDMQIAVLNEIQDNSILIMAAAPADYRSEKQYTNKIKKNQTTSISLTRNPDILANVNKIRKEKQYKNLKLIGFAAETDNGYENAKQKLQEKELDIVFLNSLNNKDSGFGKKHQPSC